MQEKTNIPCANRKMVPGRNERSRTESSVRKRYRKTRILPVSFCECAVNQTGQLTKILQQTVMESVHSRAMAQNFHRPGKTFINNQSNSKP